MLCYVMLCYVMLCYVMLCYVMLCYVMLCYVMLCYVMLCYVMLCYVMLCYVMLCYVMLCYNREVPTMKIISGKRVLRQIFRQMFVSTEANMNFQIPVALASLICTVHPYAWSQSRCLIKLPFEYIKVLIDC